MDKQTFCVLPWSHMRVTPPGKIYPCCKISLDFPHENIQNIKHIDQWWNGTAIKDLRRDLTTGTKSPYCEVCWKDEEAGKTSLRLEYNKEFAKYLDLRSIRNSADYHSHNLPMALDLNLGNICNFKCVMCVPSLSSKILTERIQHTEKYEKLGFRPMKKGDMDFSWPESEIFRSILDPMLPELKSMELKGGEPLLISHVKDAIFRVPNKKECTIALTTNGSIEIDDLFIDTLKQFKKIWLFVSVDGIDDMGEYIRYGSDWSTVKNTIQKISVLENCTFRISTVLQFFSSESFPDIFEFALKNNYGIELLKCYHPKHLSINTILPSRMEKFKQWLKNAKEKNPCEILEILQGYLDQYQFDEDLHMQCKNYINMLDSIRHNKNQRVQMLFEPINS